MYRAVDLSSRSQCTQYHQFHFWNNRFYKIILFEKTDIAIAIYCLQQELQKKTLFQPPKKITIYLVVYTKKGNLFRVLIRPFMKKRGRKKDNQIQRKY